MAFWAPVDSDSMVQVTVVQLVIGKTIDVCLVGDSSDMWLKIEWDVVFVFIVVYTLKTDTRRETLRKETMKAKCFDAVSMDTDVSIIRVLSTQFLLLWTSHELL